MALGEALRSLAQPEHPASAARQSAVPPPSAALLVTVKTVTGRCAEVDINPHNTVGDVKSLIESQLGITSFDQHLVIDGRQQDDDALLLSTLGVASGALLTCSFPPLSLAQCCSPSAGSTIYVVLELCAAARRKASRGKATNRRTPGQQDAAASRSTFDGNCKELIELYERPDELRGLVGARVTDASDVRLMVAEVTYAAEFVVTEMTAGSGGDAFLCEHGVQLVACLKNSMGTPKKTLGGSAKRGARPSGRELDELKLKLIIAHHLLRNMPGGLDGAHVLAGQVMLQH